MFNAQFAYFKNTYNILAIDIIGHGQSTDTRKGDTIDKMSTWISDILKAEHIDKVHMDSTHKEHFRNMVGNRMMQ